MGSAPIRTQGPVQDPWHKQRKGLFSMKLLSCIKQRFQRLSMRRFFLQYPSVDLLQYHTTAAFGGKPSRHAHTIQYAGG